MNPAAAPSAPTAEMLAQAVLNLNKDWNAGELPHRIAERLDFARRLALAALARSEPPTGEPMATPRAIPSSEPCAAFEPLPQIRGAVEAMLVSARTLGGEFVEGYQIKTGALHNIVSILQMAGYPVDVPLPTRAVEARAPVAIPDDYERGWKDGCKHGAWLAAPPIEAHGIKEIDK